MSRPCRYHHEDGVVLWGYTTGAVLVLVSAGTGEMKKRYGFIYVDRDNEGKEPYLVRARNPSIGTKSLRPMELLLNKKSPLELNHLLDDSLVAN